MHDQNVQITTRNGPQDSDSVQRERAVTFWQKKFGKRHLELGQVDKVPFQSTGFLGRGGGGSVDETEIDGIAVALKRISTRARSLTEQELNEVNILSQISKHRHRHVVELIGSYVRRYKGGIELGMLIWPVAHCDFSSFLGDLDYLGDSIKQLASTTRSSEDDIRSVVKNLEPLVPSGARSCDQDYSIESLSMLYQRLLEYLCKKLGCIGQAVAYLHEQGIRHKDLKPAQILLSAGGLWLTDFGWSKDTSQLTNSVTNGGDRITLRYHAPERAAGAPCGKPEDIFALGCIYLEMGYRLTREEPRDIDYKVPWTGKPFYENLENLEEWMIPLVRGPKDMTQKLGGLITRMLSHDPKSRPKISEVLDVLNYTSNHLSDPAIPLSGMSFEACCHTEAWLLIPKPAHNLTVKDRYALLIDTTSTTSDGSTDGLERSELAESPSQISPTNSLHYATAKIPLENKIHALPQLAGNLVTLPPLSKRVSLQTNLTYSSPVELQRVTMGTSVSGSSVQSTQQTTQDAHTISSRFPCRYLDCATISDSKDALLEHNERFHRSTRARNRNRSPLAFYCNYPKYRCSFTWEDALIQHRRMIHGLGVYDIEID